MRTLVRPAGPCARQAGLPSRASEDARVMASRRRLRAGTVVGTGGGRGVGGARERGRSVPEKIVGGSSAARGGWAACGRAVEAAEA